MAETTISSNISAFVSQLADSTAQGNFVVDSQGNLYALGFISGTSWEIYKSTDDGGTWSKLGSTITMSSNNTAKIAIDSNDTPHVVYFRSTKIFHRIYTSGAWSAETTIATFAATAVGTLSLIPFSTGKLGLVAGEVASATKTYAFEYNGSSWDAGTVIAAYTGNAVLAIDSQGDWHVAFNRFASGVYYAKRTAGTWGAAAQTISNTPFSGGINITVDAADSPHIVCTLRITSNTNEEIRHIYNTGSWTSEVLATGTVNRFLYYQTPAPLVLFVPASGYRLRQIYAPSNYTPRARHQTLADPTSGQLIFIWFLNSNSSAFSNDLLQMRVKNGSLGSITTVKDFGTNLTSLWGHAALIYTPPPPPAVSAGYSYIQNC